MSDTSTLGQGPGLARPVIGQFFGIFHGCSKEHYGQIVASAPFDRCNLLILAFVKTWQASWGEFTPVLPNTRDGGFNSGFEKPDDTDDDRIKLVVKTARAKNPSLKILISLGWYNEVVLAAKTPRIFAEGLRDIVQKYGLDGFDIDYELTPEADRLKDAFTAADFVQLMQFVKEELAKVTAGSPILTITPAMTDSLNKDVLDCFTYVMPQSYDHGGNDTTGAPYYAILESYDKIAYGVNAEGYLDSRGGKDPSTTPDDPSHSIGLAKGLRAAGVFSWRLDTDSMRTKPARPGDEGRDQLPTFDVAYKMWDLMHR